MKTILTFILIATVLWGCKKENDRAFSESPDERLNASLAKYQAQLEGAENGWKAVVITDSGKGTPYSFYFKFDNQNRVKMLSDFNGINAVTIKESSYRLKALQQITLMFDTYSYIHVLADPDPSVAGGAVGTGYGVDFEFFFEGSTNDTIRLIGIKNGAKATLVRATKVEADAYNGGQLVKGMPFDNISKYLNYFKRVTINGTEYEINANTTSRNIIFTWVDGTGNVQTFSTGYYFTTTGIQFETPFQAGNQIVNGLINPVWNATNSILSFSVNNVTVSVVGTGQPIKVDLGAPERWWQYSKTLADYWFSSRGFHVNGVDDAYGIKTLPGAPSLRFYADFDALPVGRGDALLFNGSYGLLFNSKPTFTSDGRAIFVYSGYAYSPPTGTPTGPINNTRNKFADSEGYYFVQTSETSYDMVSALDGKAWISWIF